MPFINEYVSEENIKEYQLDELWRKYTWKKEVPSYFQHDWTFDSEKNVFLKLSDIGREEHSNRITFSFYIKGDLYDVILDKAGSLSFSIQPYIITWELVRITPSALLDKHEDLYTMIKSALTAYGNDGVSYQVPNTIVKFNNF